MNIFVTGATGFIGRELIRQALAKGWSVTALARNGSPTPPEWQERVTIKRGDILEPDTLPEEGSVFDVVYHLAAKTHDMRSDDEIADEYRRMNVEGTSNLLNKMVSWRVRQIVMASSVKAMGEESGQRVLDESTPSVPTTAYGRTKFEAEVMTLQFCLEHNIGTTILRLPLVYGPGNKGNMHRMIASIDGKRFPIIGSGSTQRSMVYLGNVIGAMLFVALNSQAYGRVFIITDGRNYSIAELARTIAICLGRTPRFVHIPFFLARMLAFIGDVLGNAFPVNSSSLQKLTAPLLFSCEQIKGIGFTPPYSLQDGMRITVDHYLQNKWSHS